ncbi:mitochondrial amidoxime-reducing component 1-like [Watersipora subatra]|uniref:mitochondrial amidoxime-reducing component 1-like n=1 Tax=Watersipora subatra TaxID=2589382 RepID=UPI00355B4180
MDTDLTISMEPLKYDPANIQSIVWYDKSQVKFMEVGKEQSVWFSSYLEKRCILVTSVCEHEREVNRAHRYNKSEERPKDPKILFSSSHPYLVVNQNSIEEINGRIEEEVSNKSFRANIVVEQQNGIHKLLPYEEDKWRRICIGSEAILFNERPCPRCVRINIDYKREEVRKNCEPTRTLLRYRRGSHGRDKYVPTFGCNCTLIRTGTISIGDSVSVSYS